MEATTQSKVWGKTEVQTLLKTNDKAAVKALLVIYSFQTQSEQASDATKEHNGVGFTGLDAELLSSFAKFYQRAGFLSDKQMEILRNKITKYWRQLLGVIEAKGQPVSYKLPRAPKAQ